MVLTSSYAINYVPNEHDDIDHVTHLQYHPR